MSRGYKAEVMALVAAATNARNVLDLNLELFEGEESSDERDSYEEVTSVWGALRAALEPFEDIAEQYGDEE
jgi:hypothetical protein